MNVKTETEITYEGEHTIEYMYSDISDSLEPCFRADYGTFFLSEFEKLHGNPWRGPCPRIFRSFDGILHTGYNTGVLIILGDLDEIEPSVKLFHFHS